MFLDEDEAEGGEGTNGESIEELETLDGEFSILSLLTLTEDLSPLRNAMKLTGMIYGYPVSVLIDSGATFNLISHELVESMA